MTESSITTDVLVVGGGGAGARAAIAAHERNVNVTLATKHFLGRSGCTPQLAYLSAVGPWSAEGDTVQLALEDLLTAGGGLGDPLLTRMIIEESSDRLTDLETYGARFNKEKGKYLLGQLAGHSKPRTLTFNDRKLGSSMMQALSREIRRRGIYLLEEVMLTKLLMKEGAVVGASFLDYRQGTFLVVIAKSVVLATGGYGAIYFPTTVSKEDTGDGLVAALDCGAEILDMENVPFLPGNNRAWGSQKSWGETPHFLNTLGERFMLKYNPKGGEFATKEMIVQSIAREVKEGRGTERGGIYSDLSHLPWNNQSVQSDMSDLIEHGKRFGYDPKKDLVEMWPLAHTPTGGILVDKNGKTAIPGLYAAGSVAYGMYGFGRIEGFTSIATQVFGKRAGDAAAERSLTIPNCDPLSEDIAYEKKRVFVPLEKRDSASPIEIKKQIHSIMYQHAWILRDGQSLSKGLEEILKLKKIRIGITSDVRTHNIAWIESLEAANMLLMSEMLLRASIERKESRGSFSRTDYPSTDDEHWLANIVFRKEGGSLKMFVRRRPHNDTQAFERIWGDRES